MSNSIREKQIDLLKCMLNFNQPYAVSGASSANVNGLLNEPSWKVLIYDDYGLDIISPLLNVKELRDLGVTAHLLLRSERDPIQDVPAIYFISPTSDNVKRLCQDLKNELYESYYLNFISPIPRSLLEDIAQASIASNCVTQISRVYDQYLNFISLEDELFCLKQNNRDSISYYSLNKGDVQDTEMEEIVNTITDGLFSVFVALGSVPIIRCPKGNAAEFIAERLDKKMRENLRDTRNTLFLNDTIGGGGSNSQLSFQRPLLILLDRNMDLATPLHHTWTYQALMHDVFNMSLNKLEIRPEPVARDPAAGMNAAEARAIAAQVKIYDLSNKDQLWRQQKGNPFPVVAESIQEELEKYKQYDEEIKNLKDTYDSDVSNGSQELLLNNTSKLTKAISSLPELTEMKRLLDMHTNIATSLLEQIKKRKLDAFFETEEKLMSKATLEKSILELINDKDCGSSEDKMRLFIIFYLCASNFNQAELDQYLIQLKEAGCDIECLKYIKRYKSLSKMNYTSQLDSGSSTVNKFSSLLSKSSKFVMDGVKNLVVKQHKFPITRVADNLIELKSSSETDDYRYFDPKLIKSEGTRIKTPLNDAVVFVIGGGNYIEYQNLLDNAKTKTTSGNVRRVIYGCTELMNSSHLISQLTKLGKEMP